MRIELLYDPIEFSRRAAAFLTAEAIATNVIAVVNERIVTETASAPDSDENDDAAAITTWVLVTDDSGDTVLGAAMANPPWNLFVSPWPDGTAQLVADYLLDAGCDLPGVTGEATAVEAFARTWSTRTGARLRLVGNRHAYVLGTLAPPSGVHGLGALATTDDIPLVAQWLDAFHTEAMPDDPALDTTAEARERIDEQEVWTWRIDDVVTAMAACSQPAAGIARIGPVFTPPDHRRNGCGAAVTAYAAQAALDSGARHVMLYADAANPTSNGIYQRLGFEYDHEATQYAFD